MPRLTTWKPNKTNDYYFLDKSIGEQFRIGGCGAYIHKYLGPNVDGNDGSDPTKPTGDIFDGGEISGSGVDELTIQDVLFMENRDRKYDKDIYEMRGVYNVSDNDFDLSQFGLFLSNDTLFMTFHMNDMVEIMGRRLMAGDVIELPHLLDDLGLDAGKEAIPKFYVVEDASRGSEGFSQTWMPHIWRVKLGPMSDSREYSDILGHAEDENSLKNAISTYSAEFDISQAIVEAATEADPSTQPLIDHLFGVEEESNEYDHGETVASGNSFPVTASEGEHFIRTDFTPKRLFVRRGTKWQRLYDNVRPETWTEKTFNASTFIENPEDTMVTKEGQEIKVRQSLEEAVRPRADYGDSDTDPLDGNI